MEWRGAGIYMLHSIISWDCSFRNFFHLIDGLIFQEYPREDFELIYVEQRSKKISDEFNHKFGLKSLADRYEEVKNKINIKIIYLNDSEMPYHLGRCNNAGLDIANGRIISIMDGDQLLPPDFLEKLTRYHSQAAVINIHRRMAQYPVGVRSYKDWMIGGNDFYKCLNACPDKYASLPRFAANIGPMISARKSFWDMIGGYDPNPVWSTVLSKSGTDVNRRLEIATGIRSIALPNCFSVHPWHPAGGGVLRQEAHALRFFSLQDKLTNWSVEHNRPHYKDRAEYTDKIHRENKQFIGEMIQLEFDDSQDVVDGEILPMKINCKYAHLRRVVEAYFRNALKCILNP